MTGRLTVYRQQTHLRKSCVVFLRPFFKTILGLVVRHLGWVDFVSVISLSAQFCFGRWKLDIIGWAATVWGGRLSKRFSNMFPESSTGSWAELQLPCCPSKQGELPENCYKTFSSTCRPRLYICTIDLNPFVTLLSLLIKAI